MVGREGLSAAARKSIAILEESMSLHSQTNSPVFRALELFRTFLIELDRIDTLAQSMAGWYPMFALCMHPLPTYQRRREREKGE